MIDFHPDKVMKAIDLILYHPDLAKKDAERIWYIRHKLKHMGGVCLTEENYVYQLEKQLLS